MGGQMQPHQPRPSRTVLSHACIVALPGDIAHGQTACLHRRVVLCLRVPLTSEVDGSSCSRGRE